MVNLDIHIVGVGNLGSSLSNGLNNLKNDLNIYLYDQNPDLIGEARTVKLQLLSA